jgi:hypothetical protein
VSSSMNSNRDGRGAWSRWVPLAAVILASAAGLTVCLTGSWAAGHVGFPLDDAWIHQTYARNLVAYGQWAFVPGRPSSGSTAPLWTLLLAVGYALRLPFRAWTYALGGLCLAGTAALSSRLAERLWANQKGPRADAQGPIAPSGAWPPGLVVGLAVALEWHLLWAAASGMETLLFALLALAFWVRLASGPWRQPFLTGLLGGALILTRPEGILAVALTALALVLAGGLAGRWGRGMAGAVLLVAGTVVVVAPYLALNLHLSGTLWPNTFYAKQAEYASLLAQPLPVRLWRVAAVPWVGGQVLLLPGCVWALWQAGGRAVRDLRTPQRSGSLEGHVVWWLPLVWVALTVGVYGLRLPVTYQHGRYLIPVIPVLLVYGIGGTLGLQSRIHGPRAFHRRSALGSGLGTMASRIWLSSAAVLFLAFWLLGARAYAVDVAVIEEEMVAVARWLDANTAPDALVAVHDIGAVGYFAQRPLLDLAGLVSPEVVPFIRDEERLLAWLQEQGAEYLVTFPSWYPTLTADSRLERRYSTGAAVTVAQGGENMVVYALCWDGEG